MSMNFTASPLAGLSNHFGKVRLPYGADLSNVIEHIAARVERERRPANEVEPIIFPVTQRRA